MISFQYAFVTDASVLDFCSKTVHLPINLIANALLSIYGLLTLLCVKITSAQIVEMSFEFINNSLWQSYKPTF